MQWDTFLFVMGNIRNFKGKLLPTLFISNLPEFRKFFLPLHPIMLEIRKKKINTHTNYV